MSDPTDPTDPTDPVRSPPARSLSPSRALDFQSCPLLYRFRVIDRLPEPPSPAAVRGTLVHSVLEALYDLPAQQRTLDEAIDLVAPQWDVLIAERPEVVGMLAEAGTESADWLRGAGDLVESYFAMEDPTRLEPAARELQVQAELPSGLVLRGFVDRLDRAPTGQVRVVDYKTGKAPGCGVRGEGHVPDALLRTGPVAHARRAAHRAAAHVPVHGRCAALRTRRGRPAGHGAQDRRAVDGHRTGDGQTGDWRERKSALCGWCAHQALCPAWGGTPPPLPDTASAVG